MPRWSAILSFACGLVAASASASAPDEPDTAYLDVRVSDDDAIEGSPFEFGLRFGPSFGWYAGAGHFELDFRARLSDLIQLVPSVRVAGGLGTDDRNYLETGGELGLRVARLKRVAGLGHFGVGGLFLGEIPDEGGLSNTYAVPYGRIGGGLRVTGERRAAWGVEGAARFGYAVHRNPGLVDPRTHVATDRSSFFGNLDLSLVLSF